MNLLFISTYRSLRYVPPLRAEGVSPRNISYLVHDSRTHVFGAQPFLLH